jgi:hypothetical protein
MNHEWEVLIMNKELIKWCELRRELSLQGLVYLIVGVMVILSLPFLRYVA